MKIVLVLFGSLVIVQAYAQHNRMCDYFKIEPQTISLESDTQYVLKFEDNFTGNTLDMDVWTLIPWKQGTLKHDNTLEVNTLDPDNLEVSEGTLKIKLSNQRKEKKSINYLEEKKVMEDSLPNLRAYRYSSSNIWTKDSDFGEGKYEIKARMSRLDGMWPAWWIYSGDGATPGGSKWNELDLFEIYYRKDKWKYTNNVHYDYDNDGSTNGNNCACEKKMKDLDQWHTYTVYFTETTLSFYIDEDLIIKKHKYKNWLGFPVDGSRPKRKAKKEMYGWPREKGQLILNMALENLKAETPRDDDQFPCVFEVDYVRYWEIK